MSRYNRVPTKFWVDSRGWNERERTLGLYLLTCEHKTTEGLYRLPLAYAAADLSWTPALVERQMSRLSAIGFARYDALAEVVFLPLALELQAPTTAKQIIGAVARLRSVPPSPLLWDLQSHANAHANGLAEAIRMELGDALARASEWNAGFHSSPHTPDTNSYSKLTEGAKD